MGDTTLDPGLGLLIRIGTGLEWLVCEEPSCSVGDADGTAGLSDGNKPGEVGFILFVGVGAGVRVF